MQPEINAPLYEVHYTSSEKGILTQSDGFGVRTHSEDLPSGILEVLENANFFHYTSGSKVLASKRDLSENPGLVVDFPFTFRLEYLQHDSVKYRVFSRASFIGHDYQFYHTDLASQARTGNIYVHLFIWPAVAAVPGTFLSHLLSCFRPMDPTNHPDNTEMKRLLLQAPELIPAQKCKAAEVELLQPIDAEQVDFLRHAWTGALQGRQLVVHADDDFATLSLRLMFVWLPQIWIRTLSILTNTHHFQLPTSYSIVFVNSFNEILFQGSEKKPKLELKTGESAPFSTSELREQWLAEVEKGNLAFTKTLDKDISQFLQPGFEFSQLSHFCTLLAFARNHQDINDSQLLNACREMDWLHASTILKKLIQESVSQRFGQSIEVQNTEILAQAFQLIDVMQERGLVDLRAYQRRWGKMLSEWILQAESSSQIPWNSTQPSTWIGLLDWEHLNKHLGAFLKLVPLNSKYGTAFFEHCLPRLTGTGNQINLIIFCVERQIIAVTTGQSRFDALPNRKVQDFLEAQRFQPLMHPRSVPTFWDDHLNPLFIDVCESRAASKLASAAMEEGPQERLESSFLRWVSKSEKSGTLLLQYLRNWGHAFGFSDAIQNLFVQTLDQLVATSGGRFSELSERASGMQDPGLTARLKYLKDLNSSTSTTFPAQLKALAEVLGPQTIAFYLRFAFLSLHHKRKLNRENFFLWYHQVKAQIPDLTCKIENTEIPIRLYSLKVAIDAGGNAGDKWVEAWLRYASKHIHQDNALPQNHTGEAAWTATEFREELLFMKENHPKHLAKARKQLLKSEEISSEFKEYLTSPLKGKLRRLADSAKTIVSYLKSSTGKSTNDKKDQSNGI